MPFVLDASTALSLILPDELTTDVARAVAREFAKGNTALVPNLWVLEVSNALLMAERRKRTEAGAADQLLEKLLSLPVSVAVEASIDVPRTLELLSVSRELGLSVYDATYLSLARTRGLALASEDKALVRAASAVAVPLLGI